MAPTAQNKKWLTSGKVAEYCLVSRATVRRWIKIGKLSATRLPSGHYRVSLADLRDFLQRHNMPIAEELFEPEPEWQGGNK